MINCSTCKKSALTVPLYRTEPKGAPKAKWMCLRCIEKEHPELAVNIQEEEEESLNLKETFYPEKDKRNTAKNKKH